MTGAVRPTAGSKPKAPNKNTTRTCDRGGVIATAWLPLACGLSIYVRFSQSFTYIGLLATVSGQRRPVVAAMPLGSKYLTLRVSTHR